MKLSVVFLTLTAGFYLKDGIDTLLKADPYYDSKCSELTVYGLSLLSFQHVHL